MSEYKHQLEKLSIKEIFLIGNRDFSYICNVTTNTKNQNIAEKMRKILLTELDLKMAYCFGMYLCTHPGITKKWSDEFNLSINLINPMCISKTLNRLYKDALYWIDNHNFIVDQNFYDYSNPAFILWQIGKTRGGNDKCGSPLWADKEDELSANHIDILNQIVGHTPVNTCINIKTKTCNIWFCDTFARSKKAFSMVTTLFYYTQIRNLVY